MSTNKTRELTLEEVAEMQAAGSPDPIPDPLDPSSFSGYSATVGTFVYPHYTFKYENSEYIIFFAHLTCVKIEGYWLKLTFVNSEIALEREKTGNLVEVIKDYFKGGDLWTK